MCIPEAKIDTRMLKMQVSLLSSHALIGRGLMMNGKSTQISCYYQFALDLIEVIRGSMKSRCFK